MPPIEVMVIWGWVIIAGVKLQEHEAHFAPTCRRKITLKEFAKLKSKCALPTFGCSDLGLLSGYLIP